MTADNKPNGQLGRIEANLANLVTTTTDMAVDVKQQGKDIAVIQEQHARCPWIQRGEVTVAAPKNDSPSGMFRAIGKQSGVLALLVYFWNVPGVKTILAVIGLIALAQAAGIDFVKVIPALGPPSPGSP